MKFDFCIGNPPYQEETIGDNDTYAPPVYNKFLEGAYKISDKVEMVHPARFLFNAGSTPKAWNQEMLNDKHLKVLSYSERSSDVFANTDIKGGVVITYHDTGRDFGAIEIFTPFEELNSILHKVLKHAEFKSFSDIIVTSYAYHFLPVMYEEHPEAKGKLSDGHDCDFKSNCLEKLPTVFSVNKPTDSDQYLRILGRINNERVYRYIKARYVNDVDNLHHYKAFMSGATGTGVFGETVASPIVGYPGDGSTETFLSIGDFSSESEVHAVIKYVKCKFTRTLYSVLKKTQANTPGKWEHVPLQDFTSASDIDWSVPIKAIDQQLYKKYNLSDEEIRFIETHVKEMA